MNNFDGQLRLYPEICVDNFASDIIYDPKIRVFILTHFHDDHMKNLEDFAFYRLLKENNDLVKFYVSPITKDFIRTCDKYEHLTEYCVEMPCETPFVVNISSKETVTITFCGSGHCPGSVMAFIEGSRGNVLFTGDFRLPMSCASRLAFFKESQPSHQDTSGLKKLVALPSSDKIKGVDDLYIDATFFKPEVKYIPTREESVKALIKFIESFLELDKIGKASNDTTTNKAFQFERLVYMKTSARIGYEYVYQEIYKHTGYKTHVNDLIFKIYDKLPVIQSCLTQDPYSTPIHCCVYENRKREAAKTDLMSSTIFGGERKPYTVHISNSPVKSQSDTRRPIIPCLITSENMQKELARPLRVHAAKVILSAMWFTDTAGVEQVFIGYKPTLKEMNSLAYKPYKSIYRLCYSFHSSFEEIVDFVNTLRPKRLFSIALPEKASDQSIRDQFYLNGRFVGYRRVGFSSLVNETKPKMTKSNSESKLFNKGASLILRKRKSCLTFTDDGSATNSEAEETDDDDLNFGSCSDDDDHKIKKKSKC